MSSRDLTPLFAFACILGAACFLLAQSDNGVSGSAAQQVRLSEILIPLLPSASAEEVDSAEQESQTIIDRLRAGASFEQLAREHSKGPTAAQGGNVGYFHRGVLAPSIEEQVFSLNVGAVTRPIRTKQGLVILKVTDVSENPPKSGRDNIDILTDTAGINFGPYLSSALERIRTNWHDAIPQEAKSPTFKRGTVAIIFSIRKDGTVEGIKISVTSGDPELDRAAWRAIFSSNPLPALPSQFTKDSLMLRIRFQYNLNRTAPAPLDNAGTKSH